MGGTKGGSQPRLLVLGAGRAQMGILKAARGRNLFVIACERDPNAPGFEFVDRRAILSRVDEVAIGRLAFAENVNAVVASGSDATLAIASRLSERLGLPQLHSVDLATLLSSPESQRRALHGAGLRERDSIEYERGDIVVTALLIHGRFYPLAVCDRYLLVSRGSPEGSIHVWPSDQAGGHCLEVARRATEALEIRNGLVRVDLRLADSPAVLSVGPGCTGEPDEELCMHALGVDLPDLALRTALGERLAPPSLKPTGDVHACVRFSSDVPASGLEDSLGLARGATREAALEGAMKAALRVRFRGAETLPSLR